MSRPGPVPLVALALVILVAIGPSRTADVPPTAETAKEALAAKFFGLFPVLVSESDARAIVDLVPEAVRIPVWAEDRQLFLIPRGEWTKSPLVASSLVGGPIGNVQLSHGEVDITRPIPWEQLDGRFASRAYDTYVVQLVAPIQAGWDSEIAAAGGRVAGASSTYVLVVEAEWKAAHALYALPFVNWLDFLRPEYKIQRALSESTFPQSVQVVMDGRFDKEQVENDFRRIGLAIEWIWGGRELQIVWTVLPDFGTGLKAAAWDTVLGISMISTTVQCG
jgi:hypothetical protein